VITNIPGVPDLEYVRIIEIVGEKGG
jgi:hypothetical protein